jgi:hypothetical protein
MKTNYLVLILIGMLICVALLIVPAFAEVDTFTINTLYSPTYYTIDYGINTTAEVYNYSIESSTNLATANQSWLLLGSNNATTIDILDTQTTLAFAATVLQNFTVAAPDYYRYYYLVLQDGFYDPASVLTLKLYSTVHTIASPSVPVVTTIPMLPAGHHEAPWYQWVADNITWIVIVLLIVVGLMVLNNRR